MNRIKVIVALVSMTLITGLCVPSFAAFRAGTAKADITPPLGSRMYGYGARGDNVSIDVHDPLFAKALVISDGTETFAVVTLDLGSFGKAYTRAVRDQVKAAAGFDDVYVIASHTHSAPVFDPAFPSADKPWLRELERKIADAVIEAHRRLAPVRLTAGKGEFRSCHNRRRVHTDETGDVHVEMIWENRQGLPTEPVDTTVGVVAVDSLAGEPVATLVHFACHPVILGPDNLEISADYPGAMMALVEKEIGGLAMFAQGGAGDLNPYWDKTPLADGAYSEMKRQGRLLGQQVIDVRKAIAEGENDATTGTDGRLSLASQTIELDARWDLEDPAVQAAFRESEFGWIFDIYRERFRRERDAEINTVVVGDVFAFATFPGEFFVEHQMRLRNSSLLPNTLFFGYTNGELGYFPTIRAAAEGGYGATEATIVEVGAGEELVNRALIALLYQGEKLHRIPRF